MVIPFMLCFSLCFKVAIAFTVFRALKSAVHSELIYRTFLNVSRLTLNICCFNLLIKVRDLKGMV